MKILSSSVAMEGRSTHIFEEKEVNQLRMWDNRKRGSSQPGSPATAGNDKLSLSAIGISLAQFHAASVRESMDTSSVIDEKALTLDDLDKIEESALNGELSDKDFQKLKLLEMFLEKLTGKKFKFKYFRLDDVQKALHNKGGTVEGMPTAPAKAEPGQPQPVGWGFHFHHESSEYFKQTVDFSSKGSVVTADGTSLSFEVNFHFSQEYFSSQSLDIKAGDALIDPLVLRLDNSPLTFDGTPIRFDLDVDGKKDDVYVPVGNIGILVNDVNANGYADDGSELFGPVTGSGYGELGALDSDKNGWIDEGDLDFSNLRLWIRDPEGKDRFIGLVEAGIGAIFVGSADTKADLFDADFNQLAQLQKTGVYLHENGKAGIVHELDLKI